MLKDNLGNSVDNVKILYNYFLFLQIFVVTIQKSWLQSDIDKEHLGDVTYIPEAGIDGKYYPYAVMPNYQQPFVSLSCFWTKK